MNRELIENYRRVHHLMRRKRHERKGNFPDGQNRALMALSHQDSIPQHELGFILGIRPQSCGDLLLKLEKNGYITRTKDENDFRVRLVSLTEEGRKAADALKEIKHDSVFDVLDEAEQTQLNELLLAILNRNPEPEGEEERPHFCHRGMHHHGPHGPHRPFMPEEVETPEEDPE